MPEIDSSTTRQERYFARFMQRVPPPPLKGDNLVKNEHITALTAIIETFLVAFLLIF